MSIKTTVIEYECDMCSNTFTDGITMRLGSVEGQAGTYGYKKITNDLSVNPDGPHLCMTCAGKIGRFMS